MGNYNDDEPFELAVQVLYETVKAILVTPTGNKEDGKWVPKSKTTVVAGNVEAGEFIRIEVPTWLAKEKGFV